MNTIEAELIQDIKKGEHRAIVMLFSSYFAPLLTYANVIVKDREAAEEIVQDVFVKLWEFRSNLFIKSTLRGYLYRCIHNRCLNYIRENARSKEIFLSDNLHSEFIILKEDTPPDIIEALFSEDAEKYLSIAINNLPEQCREIFCLCRFEYLSYPEIAVRLNISLSTVKTQMQRAMGKLSEVLKEIL